MAYGIMDLSRDLVGIKSDTTNIRKGEFWAVKDVSFDLKRGDVLGLIGLNGSGKTTLLRLLTGIFPPDKGEIMMKGRVGALIAVGAGFHPHMTGRENIYLNGTILGMTREELDSKFDDIIEFAEIDDFIDSPVSTYSSGMRVRLGFAIAVQIKPDILLIDEVLAVGDLNFIFKCFNAVDKLVKDTAVIYVSHNMNQVERMCNKIIVMEGGRKAFQSDKTSEGFDYYLSTLKPVKGEVHGSKNAQLHSIELFSENGDIKDGILNMDYMDTLYVQVTFSLNPEYRRCLMVVQFITRSNDKAGQITSIDCDFDLVNKDERITVQIKFPEVRISPGRYSVAIGLQDEDRNEYLAVQYAAKEFQVLGSIVGRWPVQLDGKWSYV